MFRGRGKRLSGSVSAVVGPKPGTHRVGADSIWANAKALIAIFSRTAGSNCWVNLLQILGPPCELTFRGGQCTDDAFFTFVGVGVRVISDCHFVVRLICFRDLCQIS